MQYLYLDQNALSCAARGRGDWLRIRELLIAGVNQGALLCPIPYETLPETAGLHGQRTGERIEIGEIATHLAQGVGFFEYRLITAQELLSLVRPGVIVTPFRRLDRAWYADEAFMQGVREAHRELLARMADNQAQFSPAGARPNRRKEIFDSLAEERTGMLWRDLTAYRAGRRSEFECGPIMDFLMAMSLSIEEAEVLKEAIRHHRMTAIPVNFMSLALGACWEQDLMGTAPRRYSVNDEVDMARCCVGLTYCQLVITERYMKGLCDRAASILQFDSRALSVSQTSEIIAALKSLVAA